MISKKLLESALQDLKSISGADYCLCDEMGRSLISTFEKMPIKGQQLNSFLETDADNLEVSGIHFFRVTFKEEGTFVLLVNARGDNGYMLGRIAVSELLHLNNISSGKVDINDFYRKLITGSIVSADIYELASRFKISSQTPRAIYCVELSRESLDGAYQLLANLFSETPDDNVTIIHEDMLVLVKSISGEADLEEEADDIACQVLSMINTELMVPARVTYSKIKRDLAQINEGYKEAAIALEVSRIFFEEKYTASYSSLGIGRIIHELPRSLCESFLEEVFGESSTAILTEEELLIIDCFFANNLSIAEASRELFMHRSTLVYKLDKIKKKTGLDIRTFEDAITLKIAIMVAKYISRSQQ